LILRNRDGILCPAQGPATKGFATFLGFNKTNSAPAIYTQDISQGAQGRAFVVCAKLKPASKPELETALGERERTVYVPQFLKIPTLRSDIKKIKRDAGKEIVGAFPACETPSDHPQLAERYQQ